MSRRKRFGVSQALSRGLSETINIVENNSGRFRNAVVPLSRIELDPDNPRHMLINRDELQGGIVKDDPHYARKQAELTALKELAATIEKGGLIQPVAVYKLGEIYRVVAGNRRTLAAILAGKTEIEARVFNDKPGRFDLKVVQWIENTAREDLTLADRLGNIDDILIEYRLLNPGVKITSTVLTQVTGLASSQAKYYLAVLNGPEDLRHAIREGKVNSLDKAALLSNVKQAELRQQALLAIMDGMSLRALRKMIASGRYTPKPNQASVSAQSPLTPQTGGSKINLGATHSPQVVKVMMEAVLQQPGCQKYKTVLQDINWQSDQSISRHFQQLIKFLENKVL